MVFNWFLANGILMVFEPTGTFSGEEANHPMVLPCFFIKKIRLGVHRGTSTGSLTHTQVVF